MKKVLFAIAALILLSVLVVSIAEQSEKMQDIMGKMEKQAITAEQSAMTGEGQTTCMCPMHQMMTDAMMCKCIVATGDGGVIVIDGEKLMKFDENLNLVKQVQVPIDTEAIQNKMTGMMGKCPMCKAMTQGARGLSGSSR